MISWLRQLRAAFGTSFLWLISLIYFTQGFRSFVWTAISYQMKDILKLSPSASQFVVSIALIPWSIKPLYGILSDCIPIRGGKRIPYIVVATVLSLFPWILLGVESSFRSSITSLMILLTVQNVGSAMSDVVVDAMIAEAVKSERASFAGDLQSISWSSMAIGGIFGSFLGGYTLKNLSTDKIFFLFSILPTIQLFSCGLVQDVPSGTKVLLGNASSEDPFGKLKLDANSNKTSKPEQFGFQKRRKSKAKSKKRKRTITSSVNQNSQKSLVKTWYASLRSAVVSLFLAFKQPIILRPMAWFFLARISIPNLSTVMFYHQTEFLHLEASFLAYVRVLGWFSLMFGTFTYNRFLKHMSLRRILMWAHVGLATLTLLDIVLVSQLNVKFGISDKVMVLCGSALADAINQLKMMPFLIISGQLCPPGIEGTLFALFMSINNFGSTLSSIFGVSLASVLKISSDSFDNLVIGLCVQLVCTFIPVGFLFLIPAEVTGKSS
ncbi:probable folate-biopterin transporter 4 [Aristolochia californica]|uniref:probable folate-biopterin transporter 4 n=1 Tax=Aristolochia californica TaxID=171875 RepID=UPI0035D7C78F